MLSAGSWTPACTEPSSIDEWGSAGGACIWFTCGAKALTAPPESQNGHARRASKGGGEADMRQMTIRTLFLAQTHPGEASMALAVQSRHAGAGAMPLHPCVSSSTCSAGHCHRLMQPATWCRHQGRGRRGRRLRKQRCSAWLRWSNRACRHPSIQPANLERRRRAAVRPAAGSALLVVACEA